MKIGIFILTIIMWVMSKLYPYNIACTLKKIRNVCYTLWIRNFIGYIGRNSYIYYPCFLQGGGHKHISIGDNTRIHKHCILACWNKYESQLFSPSIVIGNNCDIGDYTQITSCNKIIIGDGLLTGRYVLITDNNHGGLSEEEAFVQPALRKLKSRGEIVIGNNVWIGDKVTILSGVHIGNNAIIGANTVVTKDVPNNSVVGGGTSRIIHQINIEKNNGKQ